jgi:radical SAM protein (TIGR01212 family)
MSIGTRPDCVPEEVLDLIASYTVEKPEVWVEYGLQTAHFRTLRKINRAHGVADFVDAVLRTKKRSGIKVCAHVILGLPDEDYEDMMETAKLIAALPIDGIKIHPLHIVKHTTMEKQYYRGEIRELDIREYAKLAVDFLSYLPKDIIVHRITGEATEDELIAPYWCSPKYKMEVLKAIEDEFKLRNANKNLKVLV